jgi:Lon protease-like protein
MNEDLSALQDFTGVARLFPLPGLVFFPHAVQPLHIFEPRYRQLAADALAGDRLVAPVLLRPGWEENYDDAPAVHPVACLGRVAMDQLLPDGRYNLVLRGLARVRIAEELPTDKRYRLARVEVLCDQHCDDVDELMALRTAVADLILPRVTAGPVREQLRGLFKGELPLGHLCDVLAFALPLPTEAKQGLLEVLSVTCRARLLMEAFQAVLDDGAKPVGAGLGKRFPPDFSVN